MVYISEVKGKRGKRRPKLRWKDRVRENEDGRGVNMQDSLKLCKDFSFFFL